MIWRRQAVLGCLAGLLAGFPVADAAEWQEREPVPAQGADITVTGEIVEPGLYLRDGQHGTGPTEISYLTAAGAQTLGLLNTETDTFYLLLAATPGKNPSEFVYDYLNHQVTVTGRLYERSGAKAIVVTSVEPAS